MRTFLISLKSQPRRREKLLEDLERLKLDYELFDAINGYELSEQELTQLCDLEEIEKNKAWYSKGMIGCTLSHYYLYKRIIEENLPYALIIEDDAKLPSNFKDILSDIEKHLHQNEVVLLYYQSIRGICKLSTINTTSINRYLRLNYPLSPCNLSTTGAYIVTKKACEAMIKVILPVRKGPDDWNFFMENGLENIRVLYPRVIKTYDFRSSISSISSLGKKNLLTSCVVWIDNNKVFPFYQLLAWRRNFTKNRQSNRFQLVNKKSSIDIL
jgi:glycosyl transferase, family 25